MQIGEGTQSGEGPREKTLNASLATSTIEEPTRIKEKSERSWWRKTDPADQVENAVHNSPDLPSSPTTPTSPITVESKRFEFVLPSRVKLLTLNDVFKTPNTISNITKKTAKDDFYRDSITVSWSQTIESKRHKPIYPHLPKETRPSKPSKVEMEFIGTQREVPASVETTQKNGSAASFIPRKDAQEFRPSKPQVQEDYLYRTQKLLRALDRKRETSTLGKRDMKARQAYDDYSMKRPVKPDVHQLPHNYNDMHYSDYVDRGKYDYPSSRSMAARERLHHVPVEDNIHADHQHYPHSGYSESRAYREDYRPDPAREPYHRHYDRESVARVYEYKERLYNQQHSMMDRDRRHMYEMSDTPEMLSRYERRRREELEAYRYRDRGYPPSERISSYDEFGRVVSDRHRRTRGHERRNGYQEQDPRWKEYYRLKFDEMRRHRNAGY